VVEAGPDGDITAILPILPGTDPGPVVVTAVGAVSATPATATITVEAFDTTLTATPSTLNPGDSTILSGSGYVANESVTISAPGFDDVVTTANGLGEISQVVAFPADFVPATVTFTATGALSLTPAQTSVLVEAVVYDTAITVDPTTANPGGTTTVTGTGFAPNETVTITIPGGDPVTVTTNGDGDFTQPVTIPAGTPAGPITITATGDTSNTPADADVTVVPYETAITADPDTLLPGTSTTITGTGFAPNESVSVSIPGGTPVVVTADPVGHGGRTARRHRNRRRLRDGCDGDGHRRGL
jgi:hypothetical protein